MLKQEKRGQNRLFIKIIRKEPELNIGVKRDRLLLKNRNHRNKEGLDHQCSLNFGRIGRNRHLIKEIMLRLRNLRRKQEGRLKERVLGTQEAVPYLVGAKAIQKEDQDYNYQGHKLI